VWGEGACTQKWKEKKAQEIDWNCVVDCIRDDSEKREAHAEYQERERQKREEQDDDAMMILFFSTRHTVFHSHVHPHVLHLLCTTNTDSLSLVR
jgi:hypothetical protein